MVRVYNQGRRSSNLQVSVFAATPQTEHQWLRLELNILVRTKNSTETHFISTPCHLIANRYRWNPIVGGTFVLEADFGHNSGLVCSSKDKALFNSFRDCISKYFRPCSEKEPSVTEGNGGLGTHAGDQSVSRHQGSHDSGVEGPGYQGAAAHPTASVYLTSPDKSTGSCAPPMEGGPCDKSSPGNSTPGVGISPQGGTNSVRESETKPAAMGCTQGPGNLPPASLGQDVPVASRLAAVGSMESDVPLQQEVRQFPCKVPFRTRTH